MAKSKNGSGRKEGKVSRKERKGRRKQGKNRRRKGKGKGKKRRKKGKKGKKEKDPSQKILSELSKDDLKKLMVSLKVQSRKKNPKCQPKKRNVFRGRQVIMVNGRCPCRFKEPIPENKIYQQKTVEFGIFTDRALYNQMAVSLV